MIPTVDNKFEKVPTENRTRKKIENGKVTIFISAEIGFNETVYFEDSYFNIVKNFYKSTYILNKGIEFNEGSPIGIWYYYDESGKLIKEEDTDIGYDFGPMEVVKYCKENKIVLPKGYQPTGYQTRVLKQEFEGKKVWRISYQIAGDKIQQILLDGKTGKELQKKIVPFYNP
ncbi:YD repeat (two copies) [Bergeyella zoohelcum CCUG 30536]|uniref:hypothetical protein n=1 Tax=Bergeyella zoohelcum TaxID=1015 RepID=UPI000280B9D4|nr:hypothetical protein [Bergeyella zoohelcum]EKB57644.1 YD repeat (two copies) [Bergeyella zoohelcum CCUG 30536]